MEIGWRKAVDAIIEEGRQYEAICLLMTSLRNDSLLKGYKLKCIARINAAGAKDKEIDEICSWDGK